MPHETKTPTNLHLYLIAGEQSGDLLGARLMRALKERLGDRYVLHFSGIGGPNMEAEGFESLIPMRELSLMGFAEIVPHIPRLLRHIHTTSEDVFSRQPDAVITIDSPGFCFRVIKKLRNEWPKGSGAAKLIHYVAPSVWAYKPERAKKLAALYDHVLTLLPFEPHYFEKEGMGASFVGHPVVETAHEATHADAASFRTHHLIPADATVIAMLPGSRRTEIKRHLPLLQRTAILLAESQPNLVTVMPVVPHLKAKLESMTEGNWPTPLVITDAPERWHAFAAADAALAKSGTVTLELALSHTPMVVYYQVSTITAWIMKRLIRTPYVTLINVLRGSMVIPEFLQEDATPEHLANAALNLLVNPIECAKQQEASKEALEMLGIGEAQTPSQKAAEAIEKLLA